jgi:predicted peptidase
MVTLAVLAMFLLCTASVYSAETNNGRFVDSVYTDPHGNAHNYVVFVPVTYHGDKPFPLILFLHGIGECGTDGKRQVKIGLGPAVRKRQAIFPFLVIFPQGKIGFWTAKAESSRLALAILSEAEKNYRVDEHRIYLTGVSVGAHGAWCLAQEYPKRWAAIVPVCGWSDPSEASRIKDIPCWCFHGADDRTVPVLASRRMVAALQEAGGEPRYTEYLHIGHNSWEKAYDTEELYSWLLSIHRD